VAMGTIYTPANVPTGAAPVINSFTANPTTVSKGQLVTLSWSIGGAEYNIISPQVGAVRGTSVYVYPAATTTYTLYSTNQYGRSAATVTVTVQ
jgi:peptidoglycan-associated lipoprotein